MGEQYWIAATMHSRLHRKVRSGGQLPYTARFACFSPPSCGSLDLLSLLLSISHTSDVDDVSCYFAR
ncbi:hypothetical protein BIFBRE_05104 [Bifidobacterium breve DSM 20213 = JCM 1192]|uniref:Uncharacterized protein n=1 Tax=Bifidobacterium breve DSM 20213 = JCM 1192 TaxID=518634 RepID=D4BSL2_BIFBR|nr:hypothetical protein BIFBRE_05104 [Bifidobacterium breve DSM 20213 = JCM 1192]